MKPIERYVAIHHLREYSLDEAVDLVESAGFHIVRRIGCCRGFPFSTEGVRDVIQYHAIKTNN